MRTVQAAGHRQKHDSSGQDTERSERHGCFAREEPRLQATPAMSTKWLQSLWASASGRICRQQHILYRAFGGDCAGDLRRARDQRQPRGARLDSLGVEQAGRPGALVVAAIAMGFVSAAVALIVKVLRVHYRRRLQARLLTHEAAVALGSFGILTRAIVFLAMAGSLDRSHHRKTPH
jgi:hypothetical protein